MIFTKDEEYMRMALSIAQDGLGRTWPNPSVGCVIVQDGVAVGYGRTADGGRPHAEAEALKIAGDKAKGADVYVTLEPCNHHGKTPPCSQALIAAGVGRVFMAYSDPDPRTNGQGIEALRGAGIVVETGLCAREAFEVNQGFFKRVQTGLPFVTLKQAVSADGRVAAKAGQRTQISGKQAQEYVHILRATFDAVAVGIGTVLADDPLLNVRLEGHRHDIVRVVFDSHLRTPLESRLVQSASDDPVWVCYSDDPDGKAQALEAAGIKLLRTDGSAQTGLQALGELGITRVLVEGGPVLHGAMIRAGVVDQALILKSQSVLGEGGVRGAAFDSLGFECIEKRDLGEDLLEVYRPRL